MHTQLINHKPAKQLEAQKEKKTNECITNEVVKILYRYYAVIPIIMFTPTYLEEETPKLV